MVVGLGTVVTFNCFPAAVGTEFRETYRLYCILSVHSLTLLLVHISRSELVTYNYSQREASSVAVF